MADPARASLTITLPLPPSVNNCFANVPGKGRIKTKGYRAWRRDAGWLLKARAVGLPRFGRWYGVRIELGFGCPLDIDNVIKPVLDCAAAVGVTADDRHAASIEVRRVLMAWDALQFTVWQMEEDNGEEGRHPRHDIYG